MHPGFDRQSIRILADLLLNTSWDRLLDLVWSKLSECASGVETFGSNRLLV
jgi:hypothetical protein